MSRGRSTAGRKCSPRTGSGTTPEQLPTPREGSARLSVDPLLKTKRPARTHAGLSQPKKKRIFIFLKKIISCVTIADNKEKRKTKHVQVRLG